MKYETPTVTEGLASGAENRRGIILWRVSSVVVMGVFPILGAYLWAARLLYVNKVCSYYYLFSVSLAFAWLLTLRSVVTGTEARFWV